MFTSRILCVGESGCGKSHLMSTYARKLWAHPKRQKRPRYLLVVSKDTVEQSRFSGLCKAKSEVPQAVADMELDIAALLRQHQSAYFELTAHEPKAFLAAVGSAVLELGSCLVIFDEAQSYLTSNAPHEVLDIYTRGRKFGIHAITIVPTIKQRGNYGLNRVITNEYTTLVSFRKTDPKEQELIAEHIPALAGNKDVLGSLKDPSDGKSPEFVVVDKLTGRASVQLRSGPVDIKELIHGNKTAS